MKLAAKIPEVNRLDDVVWLLLEEDKDDPGCFFLFGLRTLEEPSEFDTWHESIADAYKQADFEWGVKKHDWRPYVVP